VARAGTLVREARIRAGLGQRELARRTRVAQPLLSRIERGLVSPRFDTLDRLLRACGAALEPVERPGLRVDPTLIRERLRLPPGERVRRTAREWEATAPFRRGVR
jgi:transcriptional regulator with XRE-family HTH domain